MSKLHLGCLLVEHDHLDKGYGEGLLHLKEAKELSLKQQTEDNDFAALKVVACQLGLGAAYLAKGKSKAQGTIQDAVRQSRKILADKKFYLNWFPSFAISESVITTLQPFILDDLFYEEVGELTWERIGNKLRGEVDKID